VGSDRDAPRVLHRREPDRPRQPGKRQALVGGIQKKLEEEARPVMGWCVDRFAHLPTVKNLVPHSVVYNCSRQQETWPDK